MLSQVHHDCGQVSVNRSQYLNISGRVRLSAGFSLVEIMVGMVMGLIGMVVIFQMLTLFEGQKRTTSGGNDAQNSAAISLNTLQQDLEQAGYGISEMGLLNNCNVAVSGQIIPLAPVIINPAVGIIPAGDPNTDRLLIFYGNSNGITQGNSLTALAAKVYTVQLPGTFMPNDRVIATASPCVGSLIIDQINPLVAAAVQTVTVVSGVAVTVPATLYNLGPAPQMLAYAIRGGNLTVCNYLQNDCGNLAFVNNTSVWLPIANDIVGLRAEYGHDNAATVTASGLGTKTTDYATQAQINAITNATIPPTPAPNYVVNTYDQTTPTTNCGWVRTPAIRLVVVARGQHEKLAVTPAAPVWAGSIISTTFNAPFHTVGNLTPIDLSMNPDLSNNLVWSNYRYKVLETVVPIRNISWMGVRAGC